VQQVDGADEPELVRCARCGTAVPQIDLGSPAILCRSCGASVVVPEAERQRALAYVAGVEAAEQRIVNAFRAEQGSELATASVKSGRYGIWLLLWVVVAVPVMMFGLTFGLPLLGLDSQLVGQAAYGATIFFVVAPILLVFLLSRRTIAAGRAPSVAPLARPELQLACPTCGAPLVFEPGVAQLKCSYCGTASLAPQAVTQPMVQWARKNARNAERASDRGARKASAAMARAEQASSRVLRVLRIAGALAPAAFFLFVAQAFASASDSADRRGALLFGGLAACWLLGLGVRALFKR
jgi:LSD1 subclass zinc finger protein